MFRPSVGFPWVDVRCDMWIAVWIECAVLRKEKRHPAWFHLTRISAIAMLCFIVHFLNCGFIIIVAWYILKGKNVTFRYAKSNQANSHENEGYYKSIYWRLLNLSAWHYIKELQKLILWCRYHKQPSFHLHLSVYLILKQVSASWQINTTLALAENM